MQSQNFIKLLILLSFVGLGDFYIIMNNCCKYKTFMDNDIWYKCPLDDIGDNFASRFCQMECLVKFFGFSNGTHLNYDKLNSLIAGLTEKDSIELHRKATQKCKMVTDYKLSLKREYDEESRCSEEFTYFLLCFIMQINDLCPEGMKVPSQECKFQSVLYNKVTGNVNKLAKTLEASGKV